MKEQKPTAAKGKQNAAHLADAASYSPAAPTHTVASEPVASYFPEPAVATRPTRSYKKDVPSRSSVLSDPLVYARKAGHTSVEFGKKGTPLHQISFNEKLEVIENGFTKEQLLELKDRYGISLDVVAKILDITNRTIQNKPLTFRFTGNVAEKILALSEVYSYGIEVFEDRDTFAKWITVPNPILHNKTPLELLSTQIGMQQVKQELARIDYGIY